MNGIQVLNLLGYSNDTILEKYTVQINGTSAIKFDYVAFGDRYQQDISTSCIAVQELKKEEEESAYVEGTKYLAAPVLITYNGDNWKIWNVDTDKSSILNQGQERIAYLFLEKNRFEFMSENLIASKRGYKQLNIFEATGLIDFSREATCRILSEEFEKGLIAAKEYLKSKKNINGYDLNNITSITMHVIAALIIHSKLYSDEAITDIWQLFKGLSEAYKQYFSDRLMKKYGSELPEKIYESLNHSINYQSVDHELLGYFYESTLLQLDEKRAKKIRKEYGIYYTPRILSQEIVSSIPFENIPEEKRFILDGTCGSGSLLLSACQRLEELIYGEKEGREAHDYLTAMIQGFDIDRFASEVARLSLLLYSLPYGNKWNIKAADLLSVNDKEIRKPYIILGNPPYEEKRKDSAKTQKATAFVDKYMEWMQEGGYIGIILPESFMQNDSSSQQRKQLLEQFDILEFWMLPGQIFENNCATIVIIAQKKTCLEQNFTKIKILTRNAYSVKNYFKYGKWDFEIFLNIQSKWRQDGVMRVSPIEKILEKLSGCKRTISDISKSCSGIMMSPEAQVSYLPFDGWVPFLANAKKFRKYRMSLQMQDGIQFLNYHMSLEEEERLRQNYKGLRLRKDYEFIYAARQKVLVKMSSTPGELDCISALVDEEGVYPEHSVFCILSTDKKISNIVICALLNSKLINAYVRWMCVKRTLTTKTVRSIPVPEFTKEQINGIEYYYQKIKETYETGISDISDYEKAIDDIIYKAFGLTKDECSQIEKLFLIYSGMTQEEEQGEMSCLKYHNVCGEVQEVDIESRQVVVFLAENGEQRISIADSMPGWFLRKGAEFSAKYADGKLFEIKPLLYTSLNNDEIFEMLCADFTKGD